MSTVLILPPLTVLFIDYIEMRIRVGRSIRTIKGCIPQTPRNLTIKLPVAD